MRRILFHTPTALLANLLLIVLIFIACKKQPLDVTAPGSSEEIAAKAGSNPNSLSVVSLRVTINDVGYGITSEAKAIM